ncbi:MAG TPA: methylenetetrahydrofolate reductase [NAD(P)H] [Acidimicrobiia bacterium]|nr:methylenetetrahydrofolate reductase [Actinomycetota bacterium]MDQ1507706.1 methylenetetrahydrofolate reductase [Actinomycetota bacterium]HEV7685713.1 methylenetetrahydrofolate reductase [NAD(P)H] [Acidimicrobiia bacterium]
MTRISDLLGQGRCFSFEFFPPRTDEAEAQLQRTLLELAPLRPSFVSITYGAGGTTRERTHDLVVDILRSTAMTPMAHLCCAGHREDELRAILGHYRDEGVENILALRGDPPAELNLPPGDFAHAVELVELARELGSFSVGVAAHPEGHPASPDLATDRRHLAAKLTAADFAVTQFFFRLDDYLRLVDDLRGLGVDRPVLPGIMPVTNLSQVTRFAALSGAEFPPELAARLEAVAEDPAEVRRIGVEVASELCRALLEAGAPGLHFYTLNRSPATREIFANLGLSAAR